MALITLFAASVSSAASIPRIPKSNDTIRDFMETSETSAGSGSVAIEDDVQPVVSIVVPAYNEASRIGDSIKKIEEFMCQSLFSCELIIVDDGSADQTAEVVTRSRAANMRLIRNGQNRGKGFTVREGVLAASGKYVLFTDADLSAPIEPSA